MACWVLYSLAVLFLEHTVQNLTCDVFMLLRRYKRLLNFGDTKARRDVWLESFQLRSRPPEVAYGDADTDDDEPDKLTY